jgi:hypothetical protein
MSSYVDLHCHSTASDGTLSPTEVVRLAKRSDLWGLSLTDHDTIGGIAEAAAEAQRLGITFLPGIEISCIFPRPGTLHLLGYGIDPASPALAEMTCRLVAGRAQRNTRIIGKLNELGIDISEADVRATAPAGDAAVIGRPHIAMALVKKGIVNNTSEAFKTYLGQGGRVYVDKEQITPEEALDLVRASGGLPVLAHPVQLRRPGDDELLTVIKYLAQHGLAGIEVIHSDHTAAMTEKFAAWADELNLLKTGGSDFHGTPKMHIKLGYAGRRRIPRSMMDDLFDRLSSVPRVGQARVG